MDGLMEGRVEVFIVVELERSGWTDTWMLIEFENGIRFKHGGS